jgi:type I restriction enzyme S subunit
MAKEKMKELPKGWKFETLALQTFCDNIKSDIVDGPFGSDMKRSDYKTEGIPVLKIQNIKPFKIIVKKMDYVNQNKYDQLIRHSYRPRDIIITKLGEPLGISTIVPEDFEKGLIVADLVRVRVNTKKINLKYLCYVLNSPKISNYINSKQKGTTRARVKLSIVRELPIPYVDITEQIKIVDEIEKQFTRLDASVKDLRSVKEKLEVYRKSVLKSAFNIGCEYQRIDAYCDVISGSTPKTDQKEYWDGDILWITPKDLSGYKNKYIETTSRTITEKGYKSCSATILPENNVLMSSRAPIGYLVINKKAMCTNQGFKSFQIRDRKKLNEEFLYYQLKHIVEKIKKSGSGTTFNEISKPKAESILIKVPGIDKQMEIVEEIESSFSVIDKLEEAVHASIDKTEQLRKSILKSAFEGKLVKEVSI